MLEVSIVIFNQQILNLLSYVSCWLKITTDTSNIAKKVESLLVKDHNWYF
jgi:hypothetical protein